MEKLSKKLKNVLDDCIDSISPIQKEVIDKSVERLELIEDMLRNGYEIGRLRELVEADQDGRCVVFPCKPSDVTVYQLRNKKHALGIKDFGRTLFLDETSAKDALGGARNGQL